MTQRRALVSAVAATLAASAASFAPATSGAEPPDFVTGDILRTVYDGIDDDLLTAGLGKDGLAFPAAAPGFADPENPNAAELRRLAIYNNYRALLDTSDGGGYGTLYGPNVTADGKATQGQGLVSGIEFIAFADDGSGDLNVTMMVQLPDSFDPAAPCIVTAPSSGSRGVYGAIGTAGEWGLKNGCAVAYTDKGTGTGAHDLQDNTVNLITGERADAGEAGAETTYTADLGPGQRARFNGETPDRFAFKHPHSGQNPERDWGRAVLRSVEFAFFVLGEEFPGADIGPDSTIVIASSVSNGGGSSLRAAEQDGAGLIDGVAVSEPNVNPAPGGGFAIVQGAGAPVTDHSRSLYDYTTLLNVYQGCASLAPENAAAPFNFSPSAERCASLHDLGLLTADGPSEQAIEAQGIINAAGILPEQNIVQPSHWFLYVPQAVSVTYAMAYGRASVLDNLCGYSFGASDASTGAPVALSATAEAALFSSSNGIPPTGGVNLINNGAPGGPTEDRVSTPDQNLAGALCLRSLATGQDAVSGAPLGGRDAKTARAIGDGIAEIRAGADLGGRPAIIVTGRADAILPPNHTSRAYFGLNQLVEGPASNLRYVEVTNAQHLDVLNAFAGFKERYVPLHHYLVQALDMMFDHLKNGAALPPSQVVRTKPRAQGQPISLANVPPIKTAPKADTLITFEDDMLRIPE